MTPEERNELEKALEILDRVYWNMKDRRGTAQACKRLTTILDKLYQLISK